MPEFSPKDYQRMVSKTAKHTNPLVTLTKAFLIGGAICLIGEVIRQVLLHFYVSGQDVASAWTAIILVFCAAFLTGISAYEKIAKHGGAGTLVPITGFANAVSSAAIEAKTEGFILGVGTKIFTIAGPVILYGTAASALYGIIYYFFIR